MVSERLERSSPGPEILVVHPNVELYGSDRMLLHTLGGLRGAGHRVELILPGSGPLLDRAVAAGVPVELVPGLFILRKELKKQPWRLLPWFLRSTFSLWRLFRRSPADTVLVNTITVPGAVVAARLAGKQVVCHVHEAEPGAHRLEVLALVAPLVLCHRVVAISHAVEGFVSRLARVGRRTVVVHNGVPAPPPVEPLREVPAPARLLLLGRLAERKGSDVAVEAVRELAAEGRDVVLRLVGSIYPGYEDYERSLHALASDPALAGRVEFVPFTDDPAHHLGWADVVLVPSRIEPFGLVAVEGQMTGRVVVASAVDGLTEIVSEGQTGYQAPAGSATGLADAIRRALDDWPRARSLARAAQAHAVARFGLARYEEAVAAAIVPPAELGRRGRS